MKRFAAKIRGKLIAGVLVTVPAVATFLALRFLFRNLDALFGPWLSRLTGYEVPGLGVLATLLLVFVMGVVASSYAGNRLIKASERLFGEIPVVRRIYQASKEIVETATLSRRNLFRDVVMVEYPRAGTYAYGFVTSYTRRHGPSGPQELANVFIPNPPVPTTGVLIAFPKAELFFLDVSAEDAFKLVLSGGIVAPPDLNRRSDSGQEEADRPA